MPAKKKTVSKKKTAKKKTTTKAKSKAKKPAKKKTTARKVIKKKTPVKKSAKKKTPVKKTTTKNKNNANKTSAPKKSKATAKKAAPKKTIAKPPKAKAKQTVVKTPDIAPAPETVAPVVPEPLIREEKEEKDIVEIDPRTIEADAIDDYMNDQQLDRFRRILLQWKEQLMQEVDSTVGHLQEDATSYPDPIDRASQEEGFSLELRTRDRERKLIKKIEQALDSIETGDYGFCEDCGAEIGVHRLEARPTATKCIDCKTFEEMRERQSGN